jgi:hypothetical protein
VFKIKDERKAHAALPAKANHEGGGDLSWPAFKFILRGAAEIIFFLRKVAACRRSNI